MMKICGEPVCVAPTGDRCGEGAVWHPTENAVYWTDINRFLVHRYDPQDQSVRTWFFNEPATSIILTERDDTLAVVLSSRVILWEPHTDKRHDHGFYLPNSPKVRLNEGKADPRGSLWIGSMRNNVLPDGSTDDAGGRDGILYRVDVDGSISEWCHDLGIQNTLAWSPDGKLLYFGDTLSNVLYVSDYDRSNAVLSNKRALFRGFSRGLPDGSAMDAEGFLWNCRYDGGCIVRVASDGSVNDVIEMPVSNITTCAFGAEDASVLYVTTASKGAPESERLAGSLFAIQTTTRGRPENRLKL